MLSGKVESLVKKQIIIELLEQKYRFKISIVTSEY